MRWRRTSRANRRCRRWRGSGGSTGRCERADGPRPCPRHSATTAAVPIPRSRVVHLGVPRCDLTRSMSRSGRSTPRREPCITAAAAITARGTARSFPSITSAIRSLYARKFSFLSWSYQMWASRYFSLGPSSASAHSRTRTSAACRPSPGHGQPAADPETRSLTWPPPFRWCVGLDEDKARRRGCGRQCGGQDDRGSRRGRRRRRVRWEFLDHLAAAWEERKREAFLPAIRWLGP